MIRDDDGLLRARIHAALDPVHRPAPDLVRRCVEAAERAQRRGRTPALLVAAVVSVVAALVVVLTLLQHQLSHGGPAPAQTPTPTPQHLLYTLDAANTLSALDAQSLRVVWRRTASAPVSGAAAPRSLLRLSSDGRTLWVLPLDTPRGGTALRSFDAATGTPGAVVPLSTAAGAAYSALAIDPTSGDLAAVGQDASRIVVTLVDPRRGVVLSTTATRTLPAAAPVGLDLAIDAAFSADGSRLWYSYGPADADRTGIDWATVSGAGLQPCTAPAPGAACAAGFGRGLVVTGDDVLAADGASPQSLAELGADGAVLRRLPTGLTAGAAGEVVLSADGSTAIVVGGCANGGGVARVDLGSGSVQTVATPAPAGGPPGAATPCGVRPRLLAGGDVAVSRLDSADADANSAGLVEIVDPASGRILRSAALPAAVADLLAGP